MAPEGAAAMVSIKWCLWAVQKKASISIVEWAEWYGTRLLEMVCPVSGMVPQAVIVA